MANHIADPAFLDDAVDAFSFNYEWWHVTGMVVDEDGYQKNTFTKLPLSGSLQPQSYRRNAQKEGNIEDRPYDFYCKSIYRIDVGDFIRYQNNWMIVDSVQPYDEYGVRKVSLESINISQYRDLQEAIKALTGEVII